jgi:hypothetical protein
MGGLLGIRVENIRIKHDNYSHGRTRARTRARTHARAPNQEQLNGRKIRTTLLYRFVRKIPFGIDKKDVSHAH